MSSGTPSYHLWVKPAGAAHALLARTIRDLADELGTPAFEPHVTLLGSLDGPEREHRRRTEMLCRLLRPVPFVLTEPGYLDEYFRCVFMLVDETREVRWYRASALHAFDRPEEPFMPHVSLVDRLPHGIPQAADRCAAPSRASHDVPCHEPGPGQGRQSGAERLA